MIQEYLYDGGLLGCDNISTYRTSALKMKAVSSSEPLVPIYKAITTQMITNDIFTTSRISNHINTYLPLQHNIITEHHGQMVNMPTLYSGGPRFDSRSQQLAILIEGFCGFPQSRQKNAGIVP